MEIRPFVRYAAHHVWLDTYWLNRSIWDHEFVFIEQGSLKFIIDGKEYIAKENDLHLSTVAEAYHSAMAKLGIMLKGLKD